MTQTGWTHQYRTALQWGLAVLCVFGVGWYFYRHRQDLELFLSLRPSTILVLLVLFTVHLWLYSLQFYFVLRQCAGRQFPFLIFFKTIILGRFLSSIAPQAGAIYRAVYLKRTFDISYTRYLSGFFCFLWIDAAMNILLSAGVFAWYEPGFRIGSISVWWILAAMAAGWFLPIFFEMLFGRISFQIRWLAWLHSRVSELLHAAVLSLSNRRMLGVVMAVNTVNFINNILIFYLCLSVTAQRITVPVTAVFFILLKLSSYIILTPGNLGIRELAYGFLSQQLGLTAGAGIVLSVFYRLFGMITVSLFGIYFGGLKLLGQNKRADNPKGKDRGVL